MFPNVNVHAITVGRIDLRVPLPQTDQNIHMRTYGTPGCVVIFGFDSLITIVVMRSSLCSFEKRNHDIDPRRLD